MEFGAVIEVDGSGDFAKIPNYVFPIKSLVNL
jgi:hypothetical protein